MYMYDYIYILHVYALLYINLKRQPTKWEKIFTNNVTRKGLISKIYKQLIRSTKQTTQSKNGEKT